MTQKLWESVDRYVAGLLAPADEALDETLRANAAAGLPPADVSPVQGRLLEILARAIGARRILELGTLGGYSTIWLARGLPAEGRVTTLEADPRRAALARENLARSGLASRVDVRVGPALETMPQLAAEGEAFDLIFLDADKRENPAYLGWALRLSRPGTLILADNVVRGGALANSASHDAAVAGVRRFHELLASEPRIVATTIQTVGAKGYDGFTLALAIE